ncbi:DUF2284 domain-containing protein [Geomonas sp. RF6]|uniref:DUF2284 domain-containing protein n=1 Tax=Geomonas sp. RF6 TaxID=2897342 RepID=UPI001E2B408A|nr:DUF2284 domain-containing protein [Geomonas sp. RF6]UFS70954.1 DUF2284 domain-containing protein [Geomonas sp. RF6]
MPIDREKIEIVARNHGFSECRWIAGKDVQVRQWVRFKCMFGCSFFGKKAGCPPDVPSVSVCREMFSEYADVLILQITATVGPHELTQWSRKTNLALLPLEREVFLAGHHKALLLFVDECRLCDECPATRAECTNPAMARPCPEALGVDVFSTVRSAGFSIEVVREYGQEMRKYAFLLVD